MKNFWFYNYDGDILKWEYFKFSVFSSFILNGHNNTIVQLLYPYGLHNYFKDVFQSVCQFDYFENRDLLSKSSKMQYLRVVCSETEPVIYYDSHIAPLKQFDIDSGCIYFLRENISNDRLVSLYAHIGIYRGFYDDLVFYVPKSLAGQILSDMENMQKKFGFTDEMMNDLCNLFVQSAAIMSGVEIKLFDSKCFHMYSDAHASFLSDGVSL